jgi:multidrug efflux pump subunit AcrA (membrane-fusion protein)
MLPSSALLHTDGGWGVWIVNTDTATVTYRPVTVEGEPAEGGSARVTSGLKPGERVASAGVHKFKDGQAIRIDQEVHQ